MTLAATKSWRAKLGMTLDRFLTFLLLILLLLLVYKKLFELLFLSGDENFYLPFFSVIVLNTS